MNPEVIVVGAGMAGLCCALELQDRGICPLILERSDGVGGRVRTDQLDGFRLDRGFQVLLTAYPEVQRVLDLQALDLRAFYPGAKVHAEGSFFRVADPLRRPVGGLVTLLSPVGDLHDKLRVAKLTARTRRGPALPLHGPDLSTLDFLHHEGISGPMIERFFRPFFGGVFLEAELSTSSRLFRFLLRSFSEGPITVPNAGMGEIPASLAARLRAGTLRLGAEVREVAGGAVVLTSGETITGSAVVLACDGPATARLLHQPEPEGHAVTNLYFAAEEPPEREKVLLLETEGGPINNAAVVSQVAPGYAPPDRSLISVTVLGLPREEGLVGVVRDHLRRWFGPAAGDWEHLRTYRIPWALPANPTLDPPQRPVRLGRRLYVAGDHVENASLQGAMHAGRRAAEAVIADLSR